MANLLDKIDSPADLQSLTNEELEQLCAEIRQKIIKIVSANGGHLASNLGTVELTVALEKVFGKPEDRIVWDVGHQAYTHKILTGRREAISTIRTKGGISGFPNRQESPWDAFTAGHSSTSISAALGIAEAKAIRGETGNVVAVIGDGALTGGLAYEGLNNAGRFHKNFIVILNDNKMSISHNVGGIARYLAHMRTKPAYLKAKSNVESTLHHIPVIGDPMRNVIKKSKAVLKQLLYNSTLFEDLGLFYYGPYDGHDLPQLVEILQNAKQIDHPMLIHVLTEKGRGYAFAEKNPGAFHGVSKFDVKTGKSVHPGGENFSSVFGMQICKLAREDPKICAVTAAMRSGTCLEAFSHEFPDRFFDVGIAEEHAITFSGGLSSAGMLPVCAIYSTFLQRSYDQLIHDAALQRLKLVIAVDRAGVVGEDGETHQGIMDAAFLNTIPEITIYSPAYYEELCMDLQKALYEDQNVVAVRYPRGCQLFKPFDFIPDGMPYQIYGEKSASLLLVTYGRLFSYACKAKTLLKEKNIEISILKLNRIKPIDEKAVSFASSYEKIFFFEEGMEEGGIGEHFLRILKQINFKGEYYLRGIHDFVPHATVDETLKELLLDADGMCQMILTETLN